MSSIVTTPPVESYFTPLSMLPNVHTSMPVPPFMHSALFAGRLYRSLGLQTRSKISLTLTHSRVWRLGLFSQALNIYTIVLLCVSFLYLLSFLPLFFLTQSITPLHAMYIAACEVTSRLQALENDKFSLASQVSHLSSVNEQLLFELQTSQQLYLTEGFH